MNIKRVLVFVLCISFIFIPSFFVWASDDNYHPPVIGNILQREDLSTWGNFDIFSSMDLNPWVQYSRGGTSDKGIRTQKNTTGNPECQCYIYTQLYNIIPGKHYVITWKSWQYQNRLKMSLMIMPQQYIQPSDSSPYPNAIADTFQEISPINDVSNELNYTDQQYSFTIPIVNSQEVAGGIPACYLMATFTLPQGTGGDGFIVCKNWDIYCIEDIVENQLRSIRSTQEEIQSDTSIIVEYLWDLLYAHGQANNVAEIADNSFTFFRWMMEHYPNSVQSDFYDRYGGDFFILLYEALTGENVESTTFKADTGSVEEAQEAVDALKITDSQGNELNAGDAAASGFQEAESAINDLQNPIGSINGVLNSWVFGGNPLIYLPIIVSLSLGLLVTIIGKNKSD